MNKLNVILWQYWIENTTQGILHRIVALCYVYVSRFYVEIVKNKCERVENVCCSFYVVEIEVFFVQSCACDQIKISRLNCGLIIWIIYCIKCMYFDWSIWVITVVWILMFSICWQLSESNSTQVMLQKVGFALSGNFSCEVSADQTFSTAIASAHMEVVGKRLIILIIVKIYYILYSQSIQTFRSKSYF